MINDKVFDKIFEFHVKGVPVINIRNEYKMWYDFCNVKIN